MTILSDHRDKKDPTHKFYKLMKSSTLVSDWL